MVHIRLVRVLTCLVMWAIASTASAMRWGNSGNAPIQDHNWPTGAVEVANLKTRVQWWEGPMAGSFQFLYRGTTEDFQVALDAFAAIDAPKLVLVVYQGPGEGPTLGGKEGDDKHIDWDFTVSDPEQWKAERAAWGAIAPANGARGGEQTPVPTMHVYVAGEGVKGVEFGRVFVPEKVTVQDTRATSAGYKAEDASVIRGRVSELRSNRPIAGAEVTVGTRTQAGFTKVLAATTDADGRYEIRQIPAGVYEVRATAKGYAPRGLGYSRLTKNSLEELPASLEPAVTVSGRAVDQSGNPLAGITVRVDSVVTAEGGGYATGDRNQVTTDAAGRFTFADLPRGSARFYAYDKTHLLMDSLKQYPVPDENLTLRLITTGGVKGKVISQGKQAGGGTIHVVPEGGEQVGKWSGSMQIGADGSFQFDMVPPGRYTVSTQSDPAMRGKPDPSARTIEIKPGEVAEVNVESQGR